MVVVVANIMTALKLIGRRNVIINRRTQLNVMCLNLSLLCAENDKIRCENIAIREAIKHDICLTVKILTSMSISSGSKMHILEMSLKECLRLHQSTWEDQSPPTSQCNTQCKSHRWICP
ncbi:unnamed protein product [Brassica oleracea]